MKRLLCLGIIPLFLVTGLMAAAAVPEVMSFQGKLTTSEGVLLPDDLYSIVFKLYQDNVSLVWTETFDGDYQVQVINGLFNVLLGTGNNDGALPAIFATNDNLYLGVTVDEGDEMAPRQRLAVAGYALHAGISDGDNPVGAVQMYGGSSAPEGWLLCDGAAVSRGTYADLFSVIGLVFGSGDATLTFNLPDFRDRFSIGRSVTRELGTIGGVPTINLAHSHTVDGHTHPISTVKLSHSHSFSGTLYGGAHNHTLSYDLYSMIGDLGDTVTSDGSVAQVGSEDHGHRINHTFGGGEHSHSYSGNTGSYVDLVGHNHGGSSGAASPGTNSQLSSIQSILPPYQAVNYIIKY